MISGLLEMGHFKVIPPMILGHEICAEIVDEYQGKNFSIKPKTKGISVSNFTLF